MEDANLGTMSQFEASGHSFIVRLWHENAEAANQPAQWRGHVDHVQSGERRYFQTLAAISQIITEFADKESHIDNLFEPMRPHHKE